MKLVYIAGPYKGAYQYDIHCNCDEAKKAGADVLFAGGLPIIPHFLHYYEGLRSDEFFLEGVMELMRRCDALYVVDGWESSGGTKEEIGEALKLNIPIFFRYDMGSAGYAWFRDFLQHGRLDATKRDRLAKEASHKLDRARQTAHTDTPSIAA